MKNNILNLLEKFKFIAVHHTRLLIYVVCITSGAMMFEEMVDDVFHDPAEGDLESREFDRLVSTYVSKLSAVVSTALMRDLTSLGSTSVIVLLSLVFCTILLLRKRFKDFIYLTLVSTGSPIIITSLKVFFNRERPDQTEWLIDYVPNLSFPSGHSLGATATYLGVAYVISRQFNDWRKELAIYIVFSLLISFVGLSRIYLGVHYPTDVIAGISVGVCWALSITFIYEFKYNRCSKA